MISFTPILQHRSRTGRRAPTRIDAPLSVSRAIALYETEADRNRSGHPRIPGVIVEGDLTRIVRRSGFAYLTLTDHVAELEAFAYRREIRLLPQGLREGQRVRIHGTLTWFDTDSRVQLQLLDIQVLSTDTHPENGGAASTHRPERPEASLNGHVLVAARRRPIPALPSVVGIVTSTGSAALGDMLAVFQRRAPWIRVVVAEAKFQGDGAAASIDAAIKLISTSESEVIVLARGGSVDGLGPMRDARVAHAVAACPVPVVAAIGHADDTTLVCKVADLAAATPTAAAYELTNGHAKLRPDGRAVEQAIMDVEMEMDNTLARLREQLTDIEAAFEQLCEQAGPVSVEFVTSRGSPLLN